MKKTRIFIVRHTETVGNIEKRLTGRQDYEVTPRGEKLIQKLTTELSNIKFDKIYSSTSGRAIKTVENLAKLNNLVGWVNNTSKGVMIDIEGDEKNLNNFINELNNNPPILSKITSINIMNKDIAHYEDFLIKESNNN